jgi:agmatinase
MYDSVPFNFLGLSDELADYGNARVVILPIPYELTLTCESGARNGPQAIISASRHLETYDEKLELDLSSVGIATLPEIEQVVSGPKEMQDVIYKACLKILDDGKFLLSLGGEHSITVALVKGHKERYDDLSVLHIDAHTDLRDSYQGSRFSHACVMARVAEIVPFATIAVRSFSNDDNEKKYSDRIIGISEFRKNSDVYEKIMANLTENVYITVDLDSFDPSVMPAVGTPEPGGLSWEEMMSIIEVTALRRRIVGADIVELSPRPGLTYADFTAAKLAYKIIARGFLGK